MGLPRCRPGGLRLRRLGRRAVGRAVPARAPPHRHRRDRGVGAGGRAWRRPAPYADRPARCRARARLRDRDRIGHEPRDEPARDCRHRRVRRHAVRRVDLHPVSAVMGRRRHRGAGAPPVGADARRHAGPPDRLDPCRSAGHSPHPARGRGHAIRLGGRPAVRDLARVGARRTDRVAPMAAHRAVGPCGGRRAPHDPLRLALGVACDGRHDRGGRDPVGLAAEASAAAVRQSRRTDDRARDPCGGRARGGDRPGRAAPDRGHVADLPRQPLAGHAGGMEHRPAARHRARVHAVRAPGGGTGLHVPGAPAPLPQPAARRAR